jgi:hypothetical protein
VHLGQLGIPQYRAKDIVEIMGDAAGQGTDGLHFLGLLQLQLQAFPLGLVLLSSLVSIMIPDHGFRHGRLVEAHHLGLGVKPLPLALEGLQLELMVEHR